MNHAGLVVLAIFAIDAMTTECLNAELTTEKTDEGYWVYEGEQKVLFYQTAARSMAGRWRRANYVHPLFDLDGNEVTEDFPRDHRHHRGVFWAWHQCLVGGRSLGDGWLCEDFEWDVQQVRTVHNLDGMKIEAKVQWSSPKLVDHHGQPVPLVDERTAIVAGHATASYRSIDFEIELRALVPNLKLGGSADSKGYGGFSPRIRLPANPVFTSQLQFRDEAQSIEPQNDAVEGGGWVDVRGAYDDKISTRGITIMCHPSSPGFPQKWILRNSASMQNAVYPGAKPTPLDIESPWRLRYRLLLHRDSLTNTEIETLYQQYAQTE